MSAVPESKPEDVPTPVPIDWEGLRRVNKACTKKFGVPLVNMMPSSEVGKPGAPLAEIPAGKVGVVDVITGELIVAEEATWERIWALRSEPVVPPEHSYLRNLPSAAPTEIEEAPAMGDEDLVDLHAHFVTMLQDISAAEATDPLPQDDLAKTQLSASSL